MEHEMSRRLAIIHRLASKRPAAALITAAVAACALTVMLTGRPAALPAEADVLVPLCPSVVYPIGVETGSYSPKVANVAAPGGTPTWEWWTSMGAVDESVTSTGIKLFDSGIRSSGSWSFRFFAAGRYPYHSRNSQQNGAIEVPLCLRGPQRVHRAFPVVFASKHHKGWVSDIQVRRRGQRRWRWASYGDKGTYFMFTARVQGRFEFRARLRRVTTGHTSRFSTPQVVRVGA
jgi:hypothetical protein